MPSAAPDNANPVIHQSSSRRKTRTDQLNLDDDDEWNDKQSVLSRPSFVVDDDDDDLWVSGAQGMSDRDEIDQDEIFGKHSHSPHTAQIQSRIARSSCQPTSHPTSIDSISLTRCGLFREERGRVERPAGGVRHRRTAGPTYSRPGRSRWWRRSEPARGRACRGRCRSTGISPVGPPRARLEVRSALLSTGVRPTVAVANPARPSANGQPHHTA